MTVPTDTMIENRDLDLTFAFTAMITGSYEMVSYHDYSPGDLADYLGSLMRATRTVIDLIADDEAREQLQREWCDLFVQGEILAGGDDDPDTQAWAAAVFDLIDAA